MNFIIACLLVSLVAVALLSCGVKARPDAGVGSKQDSTIDSGLPSGVLSGKNGKYLVYPHAAKFVAGEEATVRYTITDAQLHCVDPKTTDLMVQYLMTDMPQMGIFKAKLTLQTQCDWTAVYDIPMGGLWEIKFLFSQKGASVDELSIRFNVAD